jgi:hypothetical protein
MTINTSFIDGSLIARQVSASTSIRGGVIVGER